MRQAHYKSYFKITTTISDTTLYKARYI